MTDKTTPTAGPGNSDRHLDAELEALQQAWHKQAAVQPPEVLDLAVLRQAREELQAAEASPPAGRSWPWTRKWVHNLATAAVVVLAATLLLQLREEATEPAAGPGSFSTPANTPSPAAAPAAAATREQMAEPVMKMRAAPMQASPMHSEAVSADSETADSDPPAEKSAEQWLAEIEALYASGDTGQALRELEALQERYPQLAIPGYLTRE
jgi:hypothetical protein